MNVDAWDEYQLARHPERPTPRFYIEWLCDDFFELRGDRTGGDDPASLIGLARFHSSPIAVAAFGRGSPTATGFRKATRMIELSARLGLPLVTFVDTPGADPTFESEYSGLASAIAHTFKALLVVQIPVISIVVGEGGSGGALALACGDVVAIQEHAVFSVISPEGAAEILHADTGRAREVAGQIRPTAADLVSLGLADHILEEPAPAAHADPDAAAGIIASWLGDALGRVKAFPAGRVRRASGAIRAS